MFHALRMKATYPQAALYENRDLTIHRLRILAGKYQNDIHVQAAYTWFQNHEIRVFDELYWRRLGEIKYVLDHYGALDAAATRATQLAAQQAAAAQAAQLAAQQAQQAAARAAELAAQRAQQEAAARAAQLAAERAQQVAAAQVAHTRRFEVLKIEEADGNNLLNTAEDTERHALYEAALLAIAEIAQKETNTASTNAMDMFDMIDRVAGTAIPDNRFFTCAQAEATKTATIQLLNQGSLTS